MLCHFVGAILPSHRLSIFDLKFEISNVACCADEEVFTLASLDPYGTATFLCMVSGGVLLLTKGQFVLVLTERELRRIQRTVPQSLRKYSWGLEFGIRAQTGEWD